MKTGKQPEKNRRSLRKNAETLSAGKSKTLTNISKNELQNLMHELQVHQIELEMQNEELRQAKLNLDETRNKYVDLYNFAPAGHFTLSPSHY